MSRLQMPAKGKSAAMLAELQAAHAADGDKARGGAQESNAETNAATLQESNATSQPTAPIAPGDLEPPRVPDTTTIGAEALTISQRRERLSLAQARGAEDQLMVVTIRVPMCLNRYMDEYVARRNLADPRTKYRKQDAVAAAFAAFYADHPLPPAPEIDEL